MLEQYFYNTGYELSLVIVIIFTGLIFSKIIYNLIQNITKRFLFEKLQKAIEYLNTPIVLLVFYFVFKEGLNFLDLTIRGEQLFESVSFVLLSITILSFTIKLIKYILELGFEQRKKYSKETITLHVQIFTQKLISAFIIIVGLIYIVDELGYNITALVTGLGIGGLALAFAAQDSLKNLFGGITVFLDRPFEIGDRIKLDADREGFVRKIGLRTTILETFAGTQIIVPNARVSDTILENISRETARRISMIISLEYKTTHKELEKAKKILKEIILENKDTEDKCRIAFTDFADSSLNITVIYWIKNLDNIFGARDAINTEIKKRFDKAKLSFAFPSRTLYIKK
jgi:MscS family membrane protein